MSASEQFSGVGKLSVFNCTHKKRQKDFEIQTKRSNHVEKNKLLLFQLNKGASVIDLEKHGAQVCKEQSRWVWPGELTLEFLVQKNQIHRASAGAGCEQWGGLGQTEIQCHRPNTAHGWLRKFSEWKMLRK